VSVSQPQVSEQSAELLQSLAHKIVSLRPSPVLKIAIDGVDGAGKTTFAKLLAPYIEKLGRPVIRASADGFHNPKEIRYRLGRNSPEGFFRDSYNYEVMKEVLLDPLSGGGDGIFRSAVFDVDLDLPVTLREEKAPPDAILLLDGIFLHRPELCQYWAYSIFLDVPFEVSIPRGAQRGSGSADINAASNVRYIHGQKLYFEECRPKTKASVVIDYWDVKSPRILG
jgi:uridine kinase